MHGRFFEEGYNSDLLCEVDGNSVGLSYIFTRIRGDYFELSYIGTIPSHAVAIDVNT